MHSKLELVILNVGLGSILRSRVGSGDIPPSLVECAVPRHQAAQCDDRRQRPRHPYRLRIVQAGNQPPSRSPFTRWSVYMIPYAFQH